MSSGLETLLEAARYLELQEQQNIAPSPSPPSSIGGRYHLQHYNNNNTSINSNNITSGGSSGGTTTGNNNRSNSSLRQMSSPPASPIYATATNPTASNNQTAGINRHDFAEFGTIPTSVTPRNSEGRNANGNGTPTSTTTIVHNGNVHNVITATAEDSSQSSLNLSSSGYLSGSSANSSVGGGCGGTNLNLSNSTAGTNSLNNGDHQQIPVQTQATGRRRTTSTNSNGGTQRSPCILRAGTREVHNKLEKHRRAHLKECFEQLKLQLQLKDEEKKKTSNLAILGAAYRHVMSLRRKERELEQQVEQLAKDKINAQKKILNLKRELTSKFDNIDLSNIISEGDIGNIPPERVSDPLSDSLSLSSGRGSVRYSSSSSLSSVTTVSSPLGSGMQISMPTAISPVISVHSNTSPISPHLKSISPVTSSMPLSLTTKNMSGTALTRNSPTPSTPSPSPSSSGVSSSSPVTSSSSPPIGNTTAIKIPHLSNGIKLSPTSSSQNIALVSTAPCSLSTTAINITTSDSNGLCITSPTATSSGIPINFNSSQNVQITSSTLKDLTGKNGVCRKTPENRETSPPGVILGNTSNLGCGKELKMEKLFDESEQSTKVIKLLNGIALAPVDKDNKILSSTPLALSQVVGGGGLVVSSFPMLTTSSPGLRVIGTNGLATIELSTPTVQQSQNRNPQQSPPTTTVTSPSGAQLHKLLVSGTTASGNNSAGNNSTVNHSGNVASELARLPGGAELNILPAGTNGTTALYRGNGKLAIVNNSITLKGTDATATSGRAVHVVTPIQSGAPISGLTPIVVSQGQPGSNLAHIIASSPQLAGKVNLSVGGQALPLISTQYLSSMKQMVVAVASNTTPTLSSVPPTPTSATVATGTANGNSS